MKIVHVTGYYAKNYGYQENLLPLGQFELGNDVHIFSGKNEPDFGYNSHSREKPLGTFNDKGVFVTRLDHYFEIVNRTPFLKGLFAKICKEEQTTVPVSGGKTKRKNALTELPISFKELLQIEKDIIDIISKDIVALETLYLELYSLDIVTKKDIETFENDKKKLEELQNKLSKKESGFNNTN